MCSTRSSSRRVLAVVLLGVYMLLGVAADGLGGGVVRGMNYLWDEGGRRRRREQCSR